MTEGVSGTQAKPSPDLNLGDRQLTCVSVAVSTRRAFTRVAAPLDRVPIDRQLLIEVGEERFEARTSENAARRPFDRSEHRRPDAETGPVVMTSGS